VYQALSGIDNTITICGHCQASVRAQIAAAEPVTPTTQQHVLHNATAANLESFVVFWAAPTAAPAPNPSKQPSLAAAWAHLATCADPALPRNSSSSATPAAAVPERTAVEATMVWAFHLQQDLGNSTKLQQAANASLQKLHQRVASLCNTSSIQWNKTVADSMATATLVWQKASVTGREAIDVCASLYNASSTQLVKAVADSEAVAAAALQKALVALCSAADVSLLKVDSRAVSQLLAEHPMVLAASLCVVLGAAMLCLGVWGRLVRLGQAAGDALLQFDCEYVRWQFYDLYYRPCWKYNVCWAFCAIVAVGRVVLAASWWVQSRLDPSHWANGVDWMPLFLAPVVPLLLLSVVAWRAGQKESERCGAQHIYPWEIRPNTALASWLEARGAWFVALLLCLACVGAVAVVSLVFICIWCTGEYHLWAAVGLVGGAVLLRVLLWLYQVLRAVAVGCFVAVAAVVRYALSAAWALYHPGAWAAATQQRALDAAPEPWDDAGLAKLHSIILQDSFACMAESVLWWQFWYEACWFVTACVTIKGCILVLRLCLSGTAVWASPFDVLSLLAHTFMLVPILMVLLYICFRRDEHHHNALHAFVLKHQEQWRVRSEHLDWTLNHAPTYWLALRVQQGAAAQLVAALSPVSLGTRALQLAQAAGQYMYAVAAALLRRVLYAVLGITEAGMAQLRDYISQDAFGCVCRPLVLWGCLSKVSCVLLACAAMCFVLLMWAACLYGSIPVLGFEQHVAPVLAALPLFGALGFMVVAHAKWEKHFESPALRVFVCDSPPSWADTAAEQIWVLNHAPTYWLAMQVERVTAQLAAALSPVALATRALHLAQAVVCGVYAVAAAAVSRTVRAVLCPTESPFFHARPNFSRQAHCPEMFALVGQPSFAAAWLPVLRGWVARVAAGGCAMAGAVASIYLVVAAAGSILLQSMFSSLVAVVVGLGPVLVGALLFVAAHQQVRQAQKALGWYLYGCPLLQRYVDDLGSNVWDVIEHIQGDAFWYWLALKVEGCGGWVLRVVLGAVAGVQSLQVVQAMCGSGGSALVVLFLAASLAAEGLWVVITFLWPVACWCCAKAAAVACCVLRAALSLVCAAVTLVACLLRLLPAAGRCLWVKAAAAAAACRNQQQPVQAVARRLFDDDAAAGPCVVAEIRLKPSATVHKDASRRAAAAADQAPTTVQRKAQSTSSSPAKDGSPLKWA
jgi:hypothetical protein